MRYHYGLILIIFMFSVSFPTTSNAILFTGVGYSDTQDAFNAASHRFVHRTDTTYWVTYHDGVSPVLYTSLDGIDWTIVTTGNTSNHLFTTPDPDPADWGARFVGTTLYLTASIPSQAYYEKYTLNPDGTITKDTLRDESIGTHGSNNEANITLTATGLVRVFWRYDPRVYFFAANADETVWDDRYKTGYITQTNSYFPFALPLGSDNNLLIISFDDPINHELRSMAYEDANDTWGSSELVTDDLPANAPQAYHQQISAVKTDDHLIHLVYINTAGRIIHMQRKSKISDSWSTRSTDVTGATDHQRLSLSTDGTYLWVFYDKPDQKIYTKQWDRSTWQNESPVKTSDNNLQGCITSAEHVVGNEIGVAWTEGMATPFAIEFKTVVVTTPTPTPTAVVTPSVTALPDVTPTPVAPLPALGLTIPQKIIRASRGELPQLNFRLAQSGHVRIRIYNLNGKQVASLADRDYSSGTHQLTWTIQGIGSGTYWIYFETPGNKTKEKIVIAR